MLQNFAVDPKLRYRRHEASKYFHGFIHKALQQHKFNTHNIQRFVNKVIDPIYMEENVAVEMYLELLKKVIVPLIIESFV